MKTVVSRENGFISKYEKKLRFLIFSDGFFLTPFRVYAFAPHGHELPFVRWTGTFRIDKSSYKIKALIFIFQEVKQTTRINAFFYAIFSSF